MDEKRRDYLNKYKSQHRRINLTVSNSDYQKIEYLADRLSLKPTSFVYNALQEKLEQSPYLPDDIKQELSEVKFLIRNIANNINQVVHRSHTLKVMVHENDLLMELKRLEETVVNYVHGKVDHDH
ncbi:hypothetical protein DXX93_18750 [Thalassotalea euphylliae]|uniref:Plasmid mobilization relaxosome protein MobC n=1 Tax=Thalassotalea euphylliae TaxID=1655234 RepID=A0A3E0TVB7_9GAMM|nr:hypothetical protein [Thalassotalea euphylliae]REL28400.1 hypothetical protein DXX93_18750 [Thalassotalea euphylliae]